MSALKNFSQVTQSESMRQMSNQVTQSESMRQISNQVTQGEGMRQGGSRPLVLSDATELTRLMPSGVSVVYLGQNAELKDSLHRLYRLYAPFCAPEFDGVTAKADKAVQSDKAIQSDKADKADKTDKTDKMDKILFRDFASVLPHLQIPEDARMIVSDGCFATLGKLLAHHFGLIHVVRGGINCGFDLLFGKSFALKELKPAAAVILDSPTHNLSAETSKTPPPKNTPQNQSQNTSQKKQPSAKNSGQSLAAENLPQTFAFVLSCYLALFDWDISALLFGGSTCPCTLARAKSITNALIKATKTYSKHSKELKIAANQAKIAMCSLVDDSQGRLLISGATQSAAALSMLFSFEERQPMGLFDMAFLLAPQVFKTYAAFLDSRISFCRPPDPALRAACLTEYLGVNPADAFRLLPPPLPAHTLKLADYRIGVYRDQLLRQVYGVITLLNQAYPAYFKLFGDDGYSLLGQISSLDSSLALGLGSDCLKGSTFLTFIRNKGLLDKFIL